MRRDEGRASGAGKRSVRDAALFAHFILRLKDVCPSACRGMKDWYVRCEVVKKAVSRPRAVERERDERKSKPDGAGAAELAAIYGRRRSFQCVCSQISLKAELTPDNRLREWCIQCVCEDAVEGRK